MPLKHIKRNDDNAENADFDVFLIFTASFILLSPPPVGEAGIQQLNK